MSVPGASGSDAERQRLEFALVGSRLGLWDWNMQTGATAFNERWAEIVGYTLAELEPTSIDTWVGLAHPDDLARSNAAIEAHVNGTAPFYDVEARMRHRAGHWVWVHDRGRVVEWSDDGRPLRMVGTHEDITDRVAAEQQLRDASAALDAIPEGVIVADRERRVTRVNEAFLRITGLKVAEVLGRSMEELGDLLRAADDLVPAADPSEFANGVRRERILRSADGRIVPVIVAINAVPDALGEPAGFVLLLTDISERVRAEEQHLADVTHVDALTHLPNRRGFIDAMRATLEGTPTARDGSALLLIDLDRFKGVNDSYGHGFGDALLAVVGARLSVLTRRGDVVGRLGSDEFALLVAGGDGTRTGVALAEEIQSAMAPPVVLPDGTEVYMSACIGIAQVSGDVNVVTALQHADAALHAAKQAGPGSVREHEAALVEGSRARLSLETKLRRAWDERQLDVHYQPQVDIRTGAVTGAEALLRWTDESGQAVSPGEFIPLAEQIGLIAEIGEWTLREVCAQGRRWIDDGLPPLTLAVNVSVRQLTRRGLPDVVVSALDEHGFPAGRLALELTESALLEAGERTAEVLDALRETGVRLAIDDFGTGYSSFAYLKRFRVHELKIDREFIDDIEAFTDDRAISAAIIALGHRLGLRIVAEGVERPRQLQILNDLGCDVFQGFLVAPALRPAAFEALVRNGA